MEWALLLLTLVGPGHLTVERIGLFGDRLACAEHTIFRAPHAPDGADRLWYPVKVGESVTICVRRPIT